MDIGLRNYLLGYWDGDSGHILENINYFELLRRGYDVANGKLDNKDVDFITTRTDAKKYIQVSESMNASETRERERPDNYEKIVIAMECELHQDQDGIKIISAVHFAGIRIKQGNVLITGRSLVLSNRNIVDFALPSMRC